MPEPVIGPPEPSWWWWFPTKPNWWLQLPFSSEGGGWDGQHSQDLPVNTHWLFSGGSAQHHLSLAAKSTVPAHEPSLTGDLPQHSGPGVTDSGAQVSSVSQLSGVQGEELWDQQDT